MHTSSPRIAARDERIAALIGELTQARRKTDELFRSVPTALKYERPIPERHRIAFYIGHLEAFDANLFKIGSDSSERAPQSLDRLFAFGIDPIDGALPSDKPSDWPALLVIEEYATATRRRVDRWLLDEPPASIDGTPLAVLLSTAIEHRLLHAETLAYMLNRLPMVKPLRAVPITEWNGSDNDMVTIPEGQATLGIETSSLSFSWDNERNAHRIEVPAFAIDRYMVTNSQYRRFIVAGGYEDRQWWKSEDWEWRSAQRILHPASWQFENGVWQLISLFDVIAFQGDWPVYVSHAEACAYANWIGKQLPTEAQWHRAAFGAHSKSERQFPWGDDEPTNLHGNFDFNRWDPMPVNAHPHGTSAFGVAGMIGNGWEWTCTPFAPFPGFAASAYYPGYSADFFDGRHFVLKGGSPHTAKRMLRRSFRNWFQPHYPFTFAGFRCVKTL